MSTQQQVLMDTSEEPELVELHFELEIDYDHAFQPEQIITASIAEVMKINKNGIYFDGVNEIMKDDQYYGLFCGHIPTTKHEIEKLVSIFYNSLQTNVLQQKIKDYSSVSGTPILEIRELYETDQNEDEQEYIEEQYEDPSQLAYSINIMQQQKNSINNQQQKPMAVSMEQRAQFTHNHNSMDSMLADLKELLNKFITDTDIQFDQLLENCQKQINEEF